MMPRRARVSVLLLWLVACGGGKKAAPCDAFPTCTTPPAAFCSTATVSTVYAATGACEAPAGVAQCRYASTEVDCAATSQVCGATGACVAPADPCAQAGLCSQVPASRCDSATAATTFAAVCAPVGGVAQCSYPSTQIDCAQAGQVCQGTGVCTTPGSCAIPADGAGFLVYAADGDPSAATVDFDLRAMKLDGTCDQPIASGPEYDLFPSWSRSTGLLAWGGFRGGQARVVVQSVFGGPQRVLDTGPESATAPSLSEDGTLVAFERLDLTIGRADVYVVPVAGGTPVELAAGAIVVRDNGGNEIGTCPANDAGPVFSTTPAGRFVYFISDRSSTSCATGAQVTEVWRQAIDEAGAAVGAPEKLTTGSAILGRPTVSPDGTAFAYTKPSTPATSFAKVVLHTVASGQERTVIDDSTSEPAFAPAGDALAVKSKRTSSQGELLLVDLATGAVRKRLTTGTIDVATPAFPR